MYKPKTGAITIARKMEEVANKKIWDLQQAKKDNNNTHHAYTRIKSFAILFV